MARAAVSLSINDIICPPDVSVLAAVTSVALELEKQTKKRQKKEKEMSVSPIRAVWRERERRWGQFVCRPRRKLQSPSPDTRRLEMSLFPKLMQTGRGRGDLNSRLGIMKRI